MTASLPSRERTWVADVTVPRYDVAAVVPVKTLALAKSRLNVSDDLRRALVLAFAVDTVTALQANAYVSGVVVVTSDPDVEREMAALGVRLLRDDGTGLCPAVRAGGASAASWWPSGGVLVVPADLPCLAAADVTAVLSAGQRTDAALTAGQRTDGAFLPDRSGNGTTILLSAPARPVIPRYGPGSAIRHRALGLRCLDDGPPGARLDIDTVADLQAASALGLGPRTAAVVDGVRGLDARAKLAV